MKSDDPSRWTSEIFSSLTERDRHVEFDPRVRYVRLDQTPPAYTFRLPKRKKK